MLQQQRGDQATAVQGLEQVDGVEHPLLVGMSQLLDERLHRRRIGEVGPRGRGLHLAPLDAAPEAREVLAPGADGGHHPERHHDQARVADLLPVEPEAPGLDQHEGQQRGQPLGEAVDRHVHERLGPVLEGGRQRKEENLAGGLVERVAQRGVQHPGERGRPERAVQQHDEPGHTQAGREHEEREAHAQVAVDPAREGDLDEEADGGEVERDLGQELRQVVGGGAALEGLRRHVELLLDEAGADRGEGDHEGDDLEVAGLPQQPEGLLATDALLLGRDGAAPAGGCLPFHDQHREPGAQKEDARAAEQQVLGPQPANDESGQAGSGHAAQARPAADEAEDALGLPRVVDVVGERPELADEQQAEDEAEQVEAHRDPVARRPEQEPEADEHRRHQGESQRGHVAARQARHEDAVALHQHADEQARRELDVGEVVGAQARDELGARDRFDDVVRRHRQERVGEHHEPRAELAFPELRHGGERATEPAVAHVRGRARSLTGVCPVAYGCAGSMSTRISRQRP